jgi:phosphatidylinositol 4-kinase
MFLLPAAGASTSDVIILYLSHTFSDLLIVEETYSIKNVLYLTHLCIARLLLLLPLSYHTHTGTRLKFPSFYIIFNIISALIVFTHFILFAQSDLFTNIWDYHPSTITSDLNDLKQQQEEQQLEQQQQTLSHYDDRLLVENSHGTGNKGYNNNHTVRILFRQLINNYLGSKGGYLDNKNKLWKEDKLIWILLILSSFSIILHAFTIFHVRSSAPYGGIIQQHRISNKDKEMNDASGGLKYFIRNGRSRKMLAYWVYDKYRQSNLNATFSDDTHLHHNGKDDDDDDDDHYYSVDEESGNRYRDNNDDESSNSYYHSNASANSSLNGGLDMSVETISTSDRTPQYDVDDEEEVLSPLMASPDDYRMQMTKIHTTTHLNNGTKRRKRARHHKSANNYIKHSINNSKDHERRGGINLRKLAGIHACFADGYDEFLSEIRTRLQEAKMNWSTRLEDVTKLVPIHGNDHNRGQHFFLPINQLKPFKALLTLYAHEDVFSNGKLDRAFSDANGNQALSFYAPQIICFLLHNAYMNTSRLEKWILDKCRCNVQFSLQCFWFLRAWCLQGGIYRPTLDASDNISVGSKQSVFSEKGSNMSFRVASVGSLTSLDKLDNRSISAFPSDDDLDVKDLKYIAEERELLESLVSKVIESGEVAARNLGHGVLDRDEIDTPLMPNQNNHNDSRFDEERQVGLMQTVPSSDLDATSNNSSLQLKNHFLRACEFLDSLVGIADDLLCYSRQQRTTELRHRLTELESYFLAGNSIYLPFCSKMYRICSLVVSESIALSTKERVPCIICLEVVDCSVVSEEGAFFNSEQDILTNWYKTKREPQRLKSLLSKVTKYTQEGLKKLRDEIEDTINHHEKTTQCNDDFIQKDDVTINNTALTELSDTSTGKYDKKRYNIDRDDTYQEGKDMKLSIAFSKPPIPHRRSPSNFEERISLLTEGGPSVSTSNSRCPSPTSRSNSRPHSVSSSRCPSPTSNLGQWIVSSPSHASNEKISKMMEIPIQKIHTVKRGDSFSDNAYGSTTCNEKSDSRPKSLELKKKTSGGVRPPPIVFKEDWNAKQDRIRVKSEYSKLQNWHLLPILIKSNDDLRQEQLAAQLIHCMASILARGKVPVWLYPYEIVALTFRAGMIQCIPDTISIDSLRKNYPDFTDLRAFFEQHFGSPGSDEYEDAKANFVESLAGYSMVCYLLQLKDRHNGNILLDNCGHLIHIDFGFFFMSSPGKNSGFESAPFKMTREFVDLMDGASSHTFYKFRELCYRSFLELRKNCFQIILLVEMLMEGNEDLNCFRGRPQEAVNGLQERFRLDLNDKGCLDYVNGLIDDSLESWTTTCYDKYQRFCVGIM